MNTKRRKKLDGVWGMLEEIVEQEQETLDCIPENLETSILFEETESNIEKLEEAKELLRSIIDRDDYA